MTRKSSPTPDPTPDSSDPLDPAAATPSSVFGPAKSAGESVGAMHDRITAAVFGAQPGSFDTAYVGRQVSAQDLEAIVGDPLADADVPEHLRPADDVEDVLDLVGETGAAGPPPLVTVNLSHCDVEVQRRTLALMLRSWPGAHLLEPSSSTVGVRFSGGHRPQLTVVFAVKAVCRQRLTSVTQPVWVVDAALLSKAWRP